MRSLKVFVPKEIRKRERRVALTPETVKVLKAKGFQCLIQKGAGLEAGLVDDAYKKSGASMVTKQSGFSSADILLKVNPPAKREVRDLRRGVMILSLLYAYTNPTLVLALCRRKMTCFSMDAVPRISRAQKMDALSSQASLAGYKAVMMGGNEIGKIFPLMMTPAGTIRPSKVLVFGAGVAGLQAIATAKRLGAIVEATDVRPETKEQVESLGAKFLTVETQESVKVEGGYAKEVSHEFLEKQKKLIEEKIKDVDLVITTALVIGKKAPILVTKGMVESMKPGSVIVDMAVESGGNCEESELGVTRLTKNGISIMGIENLPSFLSTNASELYARNISELLMHITSKGFKSLDLEDEIVKGSLIIHQGELVHEFTREIIEKEKLKKIKRL